MPISYKHKIYTTLGTPTNLSGDVVSVTDSAGVPTKDYTVKGKTIVWNQLLDKSKYPATTTTNGVTFTNNGDGSITVDGTASSTANGSITIAENLSVIQGHKYYATMSKPIEHNNFWLGLWASPAPQPFQRALVILDQNGQILTCVTSSDKLHVDITLYKTTSVNNATVKPQLFDLTQMFGAGNEPTTPEEFRAMFPDDYYPYNVGELKTIVPTSIEASGIERFQLLDKNKFAFTGTYSKNGVDFINNGDGTYTVTGIASQTTTAFIQNFTAPMPARHVYYMCGIPESVGSVNDIRFAAYSGSDGVFFVYNTIVTASSTFNNVRILVNAGRTVNNVLVKPQLFDLTEMFGAGNEPATPAEFWQRVPEKLYGYNPNDYKSANIPSSKYFPDGMRSAGSAYDEINFLSQKAIKRVGVRAYQTGDENDATVMTDKTNTVYELATPVETEITPPLQALSTYKGFTSFSTPNSLMQNGPLSVTYYAEGGSSPEKGWLTSYKRKLYMGRDIEWNQLMDKSKFAATRTVAGVTVKNNGDGTYTLNGTYTGSGTNWFAFYNDNDFSIAKRLYGHKVLYGFKSSANSELENNSCGMSYEINGNAVNGTSFYHGNSCVISQTLNKVSPSDVTRSVFYIVLMAPSSGTVVYKDLIIRPQLFDLTQMFGAGNEPATPEEFWSYFDHKLYPYNPGETQPLFKISRKSQWGSATPASLYVGENIIIPQIIRN